MQYLVNSNAAHWFAKRDQYMAIARKNMDCLLADYGFTRTDAKVLQANASWSAKAKRCHRIAMGFEPLMDFTFNGVERPVFVEAVNG